MLLTRIAALLKANGWALNLLFIALGAYFVAGAFNAVLARSIRVVPSVDDVPVTRTAIASLVPTRHDFTNIAERNLFGIKREVMDPAAQAEPDELAGDTFSEDQLRPCTMNGVVRATLVAEGNPEWSMAVLFHANEAQVYSINPGTNEVAADATLVDIRERAVVLRRRDHFELCSADGESGQLPYSSSLSPSSPPTSAGPGVTKVSESNYNIERGEVDKALNNLNEVATQARIVPSFKNGKANGFKLFSIKPGSIYSKIGMQNGDVIQKINGYEMNSPDKALEIYQKLKDARTVTIELQRRGQPMTFNYSIN